MIKPLFQNVLVMVNGTEASINAVKYAVLMSRLYKTRVRAVYVVDTATIRQLTLTRIFIEEESRDYEASLEENGRRYLSYVETIGREKGVAIETELRRGSIWSEVIASATENRIDAILVGSPMPQTGEHRETLSSTVRSVLLNSRCSVLVVKESMIEQLYKIV
jgi:nucleotide-binding universal stress UspA family protein